jgi:hypothetical protein
MLNWLKRNKDNQPAWIGAVQPPNEPFPFPKGMKLRAMEETTIALPKALIQDGETIGSILICDEDAEFGIHTEQDLCLVKLQSGMIMSLTRSSQAMLLASDGRARPVEIQQAPTEPK